MSIGYVTEDGLIAIPEDLLAKCNIKAGDKLEVEIEKDGSLRFYRKTLKASDVAGMLKTDLHFTIEEMDEAISEHFKREEM